MKKAHAMMRNSGKKSGIYVIVIDETSYYPKKWQAYSLRPVTTFFKSATSVEVSSMTGIAGRVEIGCSTNFLVWLTDPILNGGGAINDFGCAGADLATWFFDGKNPFSFFAALRAAHQAGRLSEGRGRRDDCADLSKGEVVLQPSSNWPFDLKHSRGKSTGTSYVLVPQPNVLRVRTAKMPSETEMSRPQVPGANADPLSSFAAVVQKKSNRPDWHLSK